MEEIAQANTELNAIINGERQADGACDMVQNWLKLSCYNIAHDVAAHNTKQGRANALKLVQDNNPIFYDDVKQLAEIIFNTNHK
jgi:hypothetical protein